MTPLLCKNGSISQNSTLLFVNILIKKLIQMNSEKKCVLSFTIIGFEQNIPCLIKTIHVVKLEILNCAELLLEDNNRDIVCNNLASNESVFFQIDII